MFTGIIEELGKVRSISQGSRSFSLVIAADLICSDLNLGDSIAVNGVCLTASAISGKTFTADVMPETIKRTNFQEFRSGSIVNLERAMSAQGRFGGHIVSGHIDGVGTISSIQEDDNAILYRIDAPANVLRYVIEKGSITIDGISLTVTQVDSSGFGVSIIPHTASSTTLAQKSRGDRVNLEADIIGKYVERLLLQGAVPNGAPADSPITQAFLAEHGFY